MRKIERLCIQKQHQNALYPVRVLRVTDYPDNPKKDFLSLLKPVFDSPDQLVRRIKSFKKEFPSGKVEIEKGEGIRPFKQSDLKWLFDHLNTYVSSL